MLESIGITDLRDILAGPMLPDMGTDPDGQNPLGKGIKDEREKAGFKYQKDFAAVIEVSQSRLSDWERGRWKPNRDNLAKIARGLNLSVDYLLSLANAQASNGVPLQQAGTHDTPSAHACILKLQNEIRQLKAELAAARKLIADFGAIARRAEVGQRTRQTPRPPAKHRRRN